MNKKLIVLVIAGVFSAAAQAQSASVQDLQQALQQALKAAAAAQKAAQQAQDALLQIQQANAAAASNAAASTTAARQTNGGTLTQNPGEGVNYKNGGDSVTLYGLIDLTASHRDHANKAGKSITDLPVAWFSGNRWGIEGEHALANTGGLKAIFKLESEFELPTGDMDSPGVLFNRDAWLGVQSDQLGKLTFGRQNTVAREFSKIYGDPYGTAHVTLDEGGYTNNNNFKQFIFYSGSATGTRYDKSVVWKKEFGHIVAGLGYQFGGVPGAFNTGTTKSGGLAYNGEVANIATFYTNANVNGYSHTAYSVGGNYTIGMVRLNTGYVSYKADQPGAIGNRSDKAYTVSVKLMPSGKFDYELGWQTMNATNAAVNGSGYVLNAFAATDAAKTTATGKRKTWYGSVFYHFDKRTELYLAFDRLNTDGTYLASQANGFTSQNEFATGMRFKF
jgi:predicted porin